MKNISKYQLKKCIFMSFEEYRKLIFNITDGLKEVIYDFDGIRYDDTDKAEETEVYHNEYITETLSKYFDIKVTSVHADDADYPCIFNPNNLGVWICYKEE